MPEDGITENFSENPPVKKRGRPRRFQSYAYDVSTSQFRSVRTSRGQLNMRYAVLAISVLTEKGPDRSRYEWICPDGAWLYIHPHTASLQRICPKLKTTLLAELGRIACEYGEDTMRRVALELCETKPKTQDAVRDLRARRLQKEAQAGNEAGLYQAIVRTIEDYLARYPETPPDTIGAVLWLLHRNWEDAPDGPPEGAGEEPAPALPAATAVGSA